MLPCVTCGHGVSSNARRCPNCGEKRPAPTVGNLVRIGVGVAVLVVVLVAVFGGFSGSGASAGKPASASMAQSALARLGSDDGVCLSEGGVSVEGATVTSHGDGSATVVLTDGAEFTVPADVSAMVVDANPQADHDVLIGTSPDC